MSLFKSTKLLLWHIKQSVKSIFSYPEMCISHVDYDKYWLDKRGDNIGALSDWQKMRADFILEVIGKSQYSFVDMGCGDGSVLNYLKENNAVSRAVGIDVSSLALDRAKKFGIEPVQADINAREFLEKIPQADYLILFEILEHIEHSEDMLKAAYAKTEKGVFFSFPNTGFLSYRLRLLFGRFPVQWRLYPGEHLRFWTRKDLKWWLDALGYKDYKIFGYKGVPIMNKIWPALFAAGFVVYIKK